MKQKLKYIIFDAFISNSGENMRKELKEITLLLEMHILTLKLFMKSNQPLVIA